jgi:hypothetical protein
VRFRAENTEIILSLFPFFGCPAVYVYETLNPEILDSEGNSHILLGAGCDNLPVMAHISILDVVIWDRDKLYQ